VATFFYRNNQLLVAPNKIASMASETILEHFMIDAWHARAILENHPKVGIFCFTRDPVDFFVSGFRFLRRAELEEQYRTSRYFDDHMKACLEKFYELKEDGYNGHCPPDYFDSHAWWGPVRTIENEIGTQYIKKVKWIRLEDSHIVNRTYLRFSSGKIPKESDIVINSTKGVLYPKLSDKSIAIIKKICDWEHTGYNLRKSIWKYQHR
jgi:hypothetical protein